MRKYLALALVGLMIIGTLSSCKTREKCPAYGQNNHKVSGHRPA